MKDWDPHVNEIFLRALDHESREAQQTFLHAVCGGDVELRANVESLLEADRQASRFLERPAGDVAATIDQPAFVAERPGTQIGPYKLHQEIGEGGMGIVYMALQKEPVRRKVALKIIKPGMDTREVIARFAAEEQALAMMDHPNIAKVFDAGTTETGRPYFVMELVNGVPLTEYSDDNNLPTRQRLELFVLICHAVQHAHQKGIIHRDIKPSNILVTLHDGVPVPKIIDFGIAKAINQKLTANTIATGLGHMIGTPLYMSPEQAERTGLDIDTRSDIYSLGVLLYELLTGSTPFDKEQLKDAGLDEVRRLIREQEPPRPSTRISTMGMAASTVSEHRKTDPVELSNSLRHELDWIVMKALEKDRTRRYETANDFARDVRRYLDDEPVEACPPSTIYRLRKFTRRNQTAVVAATAVGLALILGTGIAAGQAIRATKAEKIAEEQLQIATEQQRLAKQQTQLAQKQKRLAEEAAQRERDLRVEADNARKRAETVTDFLVEIFRSPDPERDGRTITVVEMLDKAKVRVETEFKEDRLLQAKLLGAIAETFLGLGLIQEASEFSKKSYDILLEALGPQHIDTLTAMQNLAGAYGAVGRRDEALPLMKETLRLRQEILGSEHPKTLESMSCLAMAYLDAGLVEQALSLTEETLRLGKETLGPEHADTLISMNNLACAYQDAGRWNEALRLHEETLKLQKEKLGPDHPRTLTSMGNLAGAYLDAGRLEEALQLYAETLKLQKEKLGPDHPDTLGAMGNLAVTYWRLHKLDQSIPLFEETLRLHKVVFGDDHPDTLHTTVNLGVNYLYAGQLDKAVPLLEDALRKCKEKLGPEHRTTLLSMWNLGGAYAGGGRVDEALPLLEEAFTLGKKKLGPEHPETLTRMNSLASTYWRQQRLDQSIPLFEEALKLCRKVHGEGHPDTLLVMANLGQNYTDAGRLDEAIALLEEALKKCKEKLGPEHETTLLSMNNLAGVYRKADRWSEALPLFEEVARLRKEQLGSEHPDTLTAMQNLAMTHARTGQLEQAATLLDTTIKGRQQTLGPAHSDTLAAMLLLGGVYVQAGKLAEATALVQELRQSVSADSPEFAGLLAQVSLALIQGSAFAEAEPMLRECLTIREKAAPDDWRTFNTKSMLGGSLLGQAKQLQATDAATATAKFTEAEPLLVQGYEGMQQREDKIPPEGKIRLTESLQRLFDLYTAWGKPDEAAKWQENLDSLQGAAKPESKEN